MNTVVYVGQCDVDGCYRRTEKGKKLCSAHESANKFVPMYKDLKFKDRKQLRKWLKETTRYEIEFHGEQDLFCMNVDERGEVLYCEYGSEFYIGRFIDVDFHLLSEGRSFKAHQPLRMWDEEKKSFQSLFGLIIKEVKTTKA